LTRRTARVKRREGYMIRLPRYVGPAFWSFLLAAVTVAGRGASGVLLEDPPVFASRDGSLKIIMTARELRPPPFGTAKTSVWVYRICRRASATDTTCIPGTSRSAYGGARLALQPNDTLYIRLVNELPPLPDAKHCAEDKSLALNDTNLHTHGLIVEPHRKVNGAYGDFVFVAVRNPQNTQLCASDPATAHKSMMQGHDDAVEQGAAEYTIMLRDHPRGLFWFHPHHHGIALNQVSAGLAGVITVGEMEDECGIDAACRTEVHAGRERVLILKDTQLAADGTLQTQEDPGLCTPQPSPSEPPRHGMCPGTNGEHWFHTVSGQVFPTIVVGERGDIWRIVNASGSRSYLLSVEKDAGGVLPLQLLEVDGITIDVTTSNLGDLQEQLWEKMRLYSCGRDPGAPGAVCADHVRMMPSARLSVRVLNDAPATAQATLRTAEYDTGAPNQGDQWPAIDLARVTLERPSPAVAVVHLEGTAQRVLSPQGALGHSIAVATPGAARPQALATAQAEAQTVPADRAGVTPRAGAIDRTLALGLKRDPFCRNLEPNQHRRIYLGIPADNPNGFAIATAVVDEDGRVIHKTPMQSFTGEPVICLTAAQAEAGRPTMEVWEVVNLSQEDHNFHIHQTRFWRGTGPRPSVLQDNIPIPHATDVSQCDGSVDQYERGACKPVPVVVTIPFAEVGDFVFHCHILEHEDGGMMAAIRVVASAAVH
jgi:L-ascorbate oxidase